MSPCTALALTGIAAWMICSFAWQPCVLLCHPLLTSRLRKVWQKRKCTVSNGYLTISHSMVGTASSTPCYLCLGSAAHPCCPPVAHHAGNSGIQQSPRAWCLHCWAAPLSLKSLQCKRLTWEPPPHLCARRAASLGTRGYQHGMAVGKKEVHVAISCIAPKSRAKGEVLVVIVTAGPSPFHRII